MAARQAADDHSADKAATAARRPGAGSGLRSWAGVDKHRSPLIPALGAARKAGALCAVARVCAVARICAGAIADAV
ncbi:hypothetical protein [Streptomyces sp. NPDC091040]|uniref:hypothetical protein n=1 Tax=Streptomyces sp. NPDC091040 TaxID=3365972 RepID=UPI003821BD5F